MKMTSQINLCVRHERRNDNSHIFVKVRDKKYDERKWEQK